MGIFDWIGVLFMFTFRLRQGEHDDGVEGLID